MRLNRWHDARASQAYSAPQHIGALVSAVVVYAVMKQLPLLTFMAVASEAMAAGQSALAGHGQVRPSRSLRRSPTLRNQSPLISNNCATSSRNGPSRCLKDAASPFRRCCANLKLSRRIWHAAGPSPDQRAQIAFEGRGAYALVPGRTAANRKTPALREPSQ